VPLSAIKQKERRDKLRAQGIDPNNIARSLKRKLVKRRRCRNCFKWLVIGKQQNKVFCSPECKKEFHHYGAAYGPLKLKLEKLINKLVSERIAALYKPLLDTITDRLNQIREEFT
jgi:hypothetical protein